MPDAPTAPEPEPMPGQNPGAKATLPARLHPHNYLTAAEIGLASCHVCALVSAAASHPTCPRCGAGLHLRKTDSLQRTLALTVAAAILYLPANLFPVMTIDGLSGSKENTIIGGVITFWKMGSHFVATIIFTASVIIPILKFIALFWLCFPARPRSENRRANRVLSTGGANPRQATLVYRITEVVGRWSMVDVFVVAVLVAVVRFGNLMSINPGPAAVSFAAVVILTMLAAHAFDPRLLWDRAGKHTPHALTLPLTPAHSQPEPPAVDSPSDAPQR